eukprot:2566884-Pyramimonas_sp.AAC.1
MGGVSLQKNALQAFATLVPITRELRKRVLESGLDRGDLSAMIGYCVDHGGHGGIELAKDLGMLELAVEVCAAGLARRRRDQLLKAVSCLLRAHVPQCPLGFVALQHLGQRAGELGGWVWSGGRRVWGR